MSYQFDLLASLEENLKKSMELPVNQLQYKLSVEDPELSRGEVDILLMVLSGHSISEIAITIFLSEFGIKYRLSCIYHKFGTINRLQLIKKASEVGLQFVDNKGVKHNFHNKVCST